MGWGGSSGGGLTIYANFRLKKKIRPHKALNMLKRSPVGDFNTLTLHIGNSDEFF